MGKEAEIRWMGPLLDCSGYAAAGRGYLRAAEAAGIRIRAVDRSRSSNLANRGMDEDIYATYDRLSRISLPLDAPCVQHQTPDCFYRNLKSKRSIGYTIFEMTGVPRHWVPYCDMMDEIWTGSEYSKAAFASSGVAKPIHVLPHALDMESFSPAGKRWNIENRRGFAFLSVFDFTERKDWKGLLRAYWSAFKPEDDVCLILKVYFGDFTDAARKEIMTRILRHRH